MTFVQPKPWQSWRDSVEPFIERWYLYKGFGICAVTPHHNWHVHSCEDKAQSVPKELDGEFKTEAEVLRLVDQFVSDQEALRKELQAKVRVERIAALKKELEELQAS